MSEVVYVSKIRTERKTGPVRVAYLLGNHRLERGYKLTFTVSF